MKISNLIKHSVLLFCAFFIVEANAFEDSEMIIASNKAREQEIAYKKADKRLVQTIKDTFANEKLYGKDKFSDMGIRVTARKGYVTISGRVESKQDVDDALKLAKSVEGVKGVSSKMVLRLIKQPPLTDEQLAENVRDKFVREKLFGKDTFEEMGINVSASNGVVTLSGGVRSEADAQKIIFLAKAIHGVSNVDSKLTVQKN